VNHLTTEQLSARLDDALRGNTREAADRHLAACAECRAALAALAAQDAQLGQALHHDPGEAYFESFAARVEDRIRAEGLAGAQARATRERRSWWRDWFRTSRGLAWVGGVAVVVVGAGLAIMTARETPTPTLRDSALDQRIAQQAPAPAAPTREGEREIASREEITRGTSKAEPKPAPVMGALEDRDAAKSKAAPAPSAGADAQGKIRGGRADEVKLQFAQPPQSAGGLKKEAKQSAGASLPAPAPVTLEARTQKMQEKRIDAKGEEVSAGAAPSVNDAPAGTTRPGLVPTDALNQIRKPAAAAPMENRSRALAVDSVGAMNERAQRGGATQSTLAATAAETRLCGIVRDNAGRPVAGATVIVSDLGRTASSDGNGRFCVSAPAGDHTLAAMAVGFGVIERAVRVEGESSEVALALEPVSVLGSGSTWGASKSLYRDGGSSGSPSFSLPPAKDRETSLIDELPPPSLRIVRGAQQLSATAAQRRSAALHDAAATEWERALRVLAGTPLELRARREIAEARYQAWKTAPTPARLAAARVALAAWEARVAAGPEQAKTRARVMELYR
jgi:hypothetical protein